MTEPNFMDLIHGLEAQGPPAPPAQRFFYRCGDCLGAFAVDGKPVRGAQCDCGGSLSYMGRVKMDRLVVDRVGVPCDARCTGASGPLCDCQCGGVNHGSQRIVILEVDVGGVPRIVSGGEDQAKRFARRDEFAHLMTHAVVVRDELPGADSYYSEERTRRRKLWAAIRKAERSKAHHHRMKVLREAVEAAGGIADVREAG